MLWSPGRDKKENIFYRNTNDLFWFIIVAGDDAFILKIGAVAAHSTRKICRNLQGMFSKKTPNKIFSSILSFLVLCGIISPRVLFLSVTVNTSSGSYFLRRTVPLFALGLEIKNRKVCVSPGGGWTDAEDCGRGGQRVEGAQGCGKGASGNQTHGRQ